jgi:hypothetical protein
VTVAPTSEPRTVKAPVFRSTPPEPVAVEAVAVETTPEPTVEPAPIASHPITDRLVAEGLSFDAFLGWARTQGFPWAETAGSVDEIPKRDAEKIVKGLNAVVTAIKGGAK